MKTLKPSELILNADGSIYHVKLLPEQLAHKIILVGDPQRVPVVSKYFDNIEFAGQNREIVTHTGYFNNQRLTVMSTGMGPDNIDIVMNELDALVNIDLKHRVLKQEHTSLEIIRLGTSGSLQADIPVDSFAMGTHGLGMDGLLHFYRHGVVDESEISEAFVEHTLWPEVFSRPYVVKGSWSLAERVGEGLHHGITITAPGFYGPQGRALRLLPAFPHLNERISSFRHGMHRIINFEMETSALYALGKLMGHETLTVCTVLANRVNDTYSKDPKKTITRLIELLLDRFTS